MRNSKLIWQLFSVFILIILGTLFVTIWYGTVSLKSFYMKEMVTSLESQSRLLEPRIQELYSKGDFENLRETCIDSSRSAGTRITVVADDGTVLCDSSRDPRTMDNHGHRPEILQALGGVTGTSQRYSVSTSQEMLYVAIPMKVKGRISALIRLSIPLTIVRAAFGEFFRKIGLGILVVVIMSVIIALYASRKITRPLEEMISAATRFARGDLSGRIEVSGSDEIVTLAQAMNKMAGQLQERIQKIENQRNELEIVVSSMVEGVIACDLDARVLYLNQAAAGQLEVTPHNLQGNNILEIVRNIDLLRFIKQILRGDKPHEGSVVLNRGRKDEKILQVNGAQLTGGEGERIGALIVINDVTRLLKLENIRRDFVANVSHELKTPITSIKGYVETLLQECDEAPPHFKDFLGIISKHSNRLEAIVEDLLILSRIEQVGEKGGVELKPENIRSCVASAVEVCSARAAEKGVEINMQKLQDMVLMINVPLIEQALINLIDNAVKYSPENSFVSVDGESDGNYVTVNIRDNGPGIESKHLPRLFERFYLVDKSRSRKVEGTGLGLAIVKHIVQAHNGQILVESKPGHGSVFTVKLPNG